MFTDRSYLLDKPAAFRYQLSVWLADWLLNLKSVKVDLTLYFAALLACILWYHKNITLNSSKINHHTQVCFKSKFWNKMVSKNRSVKNRHLLLNCCKFIRYNCCFEIEYFREWRIRKLPYVYASLHHFYCICACTNILEKKMLQAWL